MMFVLYSKKRNGVIIPSRSQLKWTSEDNVNTTAQPPIVNSKPQAPIVPLTSHRPRAKQPPSRSRFTWRRSSSGRPLMSILCCHSHQWVGSTPRRHSASNLPSYIVNKRYKMVSDVILLSCMVTSDKLCQIKSSPGVHKKFTHR